MSGPAPAPTDGPVPAGAPLDLAESVAGEEDPGASLDLPVAPPPGRPGQPAGHRGDEPSGPQAPESKP